MISKFKIICFSLGLLSFFSAESYSFSKKYNNKKVEHVRYPQLVLTNNGLLFLLEQSSSVNKKNWIFALLPLLEKNKNRRPFMVHVLLDEIEVEKNKSWTFNSSDGFVIALQNQQKIILNSNQITMTYRDGLYFNDLKWHDGTAIIIPENHVILYENQTYGGFFCVRVKNNRIYLLNYLPLEDYIASVLNCESWPGWPLEVNKAFAIACRTYLVSKILESRKQKKLFHIKNTNIHQTYKGLQSSQILKKAVEQTKGLILTYNKKPIDAMFDSCCGGIVPAKMSAIDFKRAPYLERSYSCNYCKKCKIYSWKIEYPLELFESILQTAGYSIKNIKNINVIKYDAAGVVQSVKISGIKNSLILSGKQMYSFFDKIKSYAYTIEKKGKMILFKGRGYGHHLGICQWGARKMVDAGINFHEILQFYYPGTEVMELRTIV